MSSLKRWAVVAFIGAAATNVVAQPVYQPGHDEIMRSFSARSGLSEPVLVEYMADCNRTQSAIYFCAYRDAVAADLKLRHAIAERLARNPACKAALESDVAVWEKRLGPRCAKAAAKAFGGGSLEPTAVTSCRADETDSLTARLLSKQRGCHVLAR